MKISEIFEAKIAWAPKGKTLVKKWRCTSGRRKGRKVSSPAQCFAKLDMKKSIKFKQTRKAKHARMSRKAKRTKRMSSASRRARQMNKAIG